MTAVDETAQTGPEGDVARPGEAHSGDAYPGQVPDPPAVAPERSVGGGEPWWLQHRLALLGATLIALLVIGAAAVHQYQDQQDRLAGLEAEQARTQDRVQATQVELGATAGERDDAEATLDETLAQLAEIEDQLATNRDDLGATNVERDEILAAVGNITDELGLTLLGVQANVDRVDLQGDQVAGLDVCLDGVNQAMNRQAVGNQLAAAAALSEVADTCDLTILSIALSLEDAS